MSEGCTATFQTCQNMNVLVTFGTDTDTVDVVCCLSSVTLDKSFAECFLVFAECLWHMANSLFPVVNTCQARQRKKNSPHTHAKKLPSCSATVVEEDRGSVQLRRGMECHVGHFHQWLMSRSNGGNKNSFSPPVLLQTGRRYIIISDENVML